MPTYDYECYVCGHRKEITCLINDRPEKTACSACSIGMMRQVFVSPPAIQADNITDTPWLKEFAHAHNRFGGKRARDGGKPIESRTDYKNYLERNKLRPDAPSISTSHD